MHVCSPSLSSSRSPFEASAAWTQSLRPELHTLAVGGPSCLPSHRQSRHERQQLQAHGEVDQPSELAPWIFRPALTASGQGIRAHRDVQRMKNAPRQGADLGSQVATAQCRPEPPNSRMDVASASHRVPFPPSLNASREAYLALPRLDGQTGFRVVHRHMLCIMQSLTLTSPTRSLLSVSRHVRDVINAAFKGSQ